MAKAGMGGNVLIDDGIIVWFNGPEWDEVAIEAFQDGTDDIENAARDMAIWEDQTGDARALLKATASGDHGDIVMTLEHGVDYGLWLEVIQNGKYAVIMRTLNNRAPWIMARTVERISRARKGRG
jgi:hypothetical protein